MCVTVLQWKCSLAISKWRKVKTWTTLSTFLRFLTWKSRVFWIFKKRKKRILELWRYYVEQSERQQERERDLCLKTKTLTSMNAPTRMPSTTPIATATIKPAYTLTHNNINYISNCNYLAISSPWCHQLHICVKRFLQWAGYTVVTLCECNR